MARTVLWIAILLTAVSLVGGGAHLLELPHKMELSREEYRVVQQIYRGWAFLGIAVIGALVASVVLAVMERGTGGPFYAAVCAALCVAVALGVFFTFTYPVNRITQNWTELPEGWEALRRRWEYSHAVGAVLFFAALAILTGSAVFRRQ